jgi:hypothetical protein
VNSLVVARNDKEYLDSGIAFARKYNREATLKSMEIDSVFLTDYFIDSKIGLPKATSLGLINDGLGLIKKNTRNDDSIGVLFVSNIFNMALGRKSPPRASLFWDFEMTFDKRTFPDPVAEFGSLNYVMVPRQSFPYSTKPMLEVYRNYFKENFLRIDESKYWYLLKRKGVP